jgi:hypothetical protein
MEANKLQDQRGFQNIENPRGMDCRQSGLSNIWASISIDHKNMHLLETQSFSYRGYTDAKHSM